MTEHSRSQQFAADGRLSGSAQSSDPYYKITVPANATLPAITASAKQRIRYDLCTNLHLLLIGQPEMSVGITGGALTWT